MNLPSYWAMPCYKDRHEPERLLETIANYFGMTTQELIKENRQRKYINARYIAVDFLKQFNPNITLVKIAKLLGGKHHSTIVNARHKHIAFMQVDEEYRNAYLAIKTRL